MIFIIIMYMFMFSIFMFILFLTFFFKQKVIFLELELLKISSIKLEILLMFDWISLLFISVVLMISSMVIMYSIEYMDNDLNVNRFIMMILMFIMSMLLLILSPNLISILLGWDGLGLVSYCLVIYYQSKVSYNSGMITVLINRIGDILILMSISLMIMMGSFNFTMLYSLNNFIYFLLMIASFTKSAQIPFSYWLPLAMAAPTPVSSLVHSSTLVTAGVYFMIRLNYLLTSYYLINIMMLVSIITMFMSGLSANVEYDLKKVIAFSTLSQLGLMFFCLSMKLKELCLFHLLIHAMFKSMLFMCAGVILHNLVGNQDIRMISMVYRGMPLISMMFSCSTLSLCGMPFLSGFFSKDLILEMFLMNTFNKFILMILFFSMGLTVSYSMRLIWYSSIKMPSFIFCFKKYTLGTLMGSSMYLLFFMSVVKGTILSWVLFSSKNVIYLPNNLKMLIYLFLLLGGVTGGLLSSMLINKNKFYLNLLKFLFNLWFMSMYYEFNYVNLLEMCLQIYNELDLGLIEMLLGNNIFSVLRWLFKLEFFKKNYFYVMIIFMVFLIIFLY